MALTQLGHLLRDEHGEPIRQEVTRDRRGRFITPRYDFIWVPEGPCPDCFAPAGRFCYAHCPRYAEVIYEWED